MSWKQIGEIAMAMRLEDFATDLAASNKFVKAGFGGFAGAGKSKTASEFVIGAYKDLGYNKPVLIIDNEKGSRFLIPAFRAAGVPAVVKDTTSLADVLTAFEMLKSGQTQFLFIDSLTKVWYRYTREYLSANRKQFMELQDWGKLLPKWQETFSDVFVEAQGSIVFTGRGGFSYEKEEDVTDERTGKVKKGQFVKSGVKMKLAGETPFEPDLNIWMEQHQEMEDGKVRVWREGQVMKDRSGLIDGKNFEQPTYEDFRPFVRYLVDVPTGAVAGETSSENLAPADNYESSDRHRQKQVALDEIQAEILKVCGQGQDAATKAAKSDLLFEIAGTRSWAKLESVAPASVFSARDKIWLKSRGHVYGEAPKAEQPANSEIIDDAADSEKIPA